MTASELYEQQHERYTKRVYPIYLAALKKQIAPVVEFIRRTGNTEPPLDILINPNIWIRPMQDAYELVATLAAKREYYAIRGADQEKRVLDFLIDAWRAIFLDYATNYSYKIDNELSETTKQDIRDALAYAYENGYNADRTATYIRRQVGGIISRHRAVTISRTESATAANLGKRTGAESWLKEVGQRGYKQWIGRNDERERWTHRALNDEIIPMERDFLVGDEPAQMPGDTRLSGAERINCRCCLVYISERRYLRMQEEKAKFELADLV